MFKPLLRTIPSLSGNFTIGCKLNEITKDSNEEYHTYVRSANIMPLQNSIYSNDINVNLLNGRYEYDVKKYYSVYSNMFYKENFTYNKNNYRILDINSRYDNTNDDRNKDYEFGCKRISYQQNGFVYSMYAPIYIDNSNELPEYFKIDIKFSEWHTKSIKIYVGKNSKINYLRKYLVQYLDKIDNKVIFCLPDSLQATYFGVDVKHGGLTQYKDNVIGQIYNSQTTINNFDNIVCQGFERNSLIIRQIIPLSFMFNINDLLNEYEQKFFYGHEVIISGHYYTKNDVSYDFYDFDANYWSSYDRYLKYDERKGTYSIGHGADENGDINIMNVGYPSLNEARYIKYIDSNKITPTYCKFKMLLSDDDDPYMTNISFGYSYLEYPNQKYGHFPSIFKGIYSEAIIKNDNLILPIRSNIEKYYTTFKYIANKVYEDNINFNKYKKIMSNYNGSWFDAYYVDDNFDIDRFIDESIFSDVVNGYAYNKGILYSLNDYKKYEIDKFGTFINFDIRYIDANELDSSIIKAKYVLSKTDPSEHQIGEFNDQYDMSYNVDVENNGLNTGFVYHKKLFGNSPYHKDSYVHYDKTMKIDPNGKYILESNYESENIYYSYDDLINIVRSVGLPTEVIETIIDEINMSMIVGFLLLDAYSNHNMFTSMISNGKEIHTFMLSNELFKSPSPLERYSWLYDRLYVSTAINQKRQLLKNIYEKIDYDEGIYGKILMFLKDSYVNEYDFIHAVSNNLTKNSSAIEEFTNMNIGSTFINIVMAMNRLTKYNYEIIGTINGIEVQEYFVKHDNTYYTDIYVDSYNLNPLINQYNKTVTKSIDKISSVNENDKTRFFIKILSIDHLKEYFNRLNCDENRMQTLEYESIFKQIYVKERKWLIENNLIAIKDEYVTLDQYIIDYRKKVADYERYESLIKIYNGIVKNSSLDDIFDWFCNCLIDRSSNGTFAFQFFDYQLDIDLYISKEVYALDRNLFKLLSNSSNNDMSSYLYLYIKDKDESNEQSWSIISRKDILNSRNVLDIGNSLSPLFTDIYVNEYDVTLLENMISKNKIRQGSSGKYDYMYNNGYVFKEIDVLSTVLSLCRESNVESVINTYGLNDAWIEYASINNIDVANYKEKVRFLYIDHKDAFNKLCDICNLTLYSIDMNNTIELDTVSKIDGMQYVNGMHIYEKDGITYGFYLLTCRLNNTNMSFYIKNDFNLNVSFSHINGYSLVDIDRRYFNNVMHLLTPFLKMNVFNEFIKCIDTIVFPYESEITISFRTSPLSINEQSKYSIMQNSENDILYKELTELSEPKKIKLLRYFNYITPYIKKTTTINDAWVLKFIEKDNIQLDIKKWNIYDRQDINIYRYHPIHVCTGEYDQITNMYNDSYYVSQIEYKHFNDNKMFNLPEHIEMTSIIIYSYEQITELIKNDSSLTNEKVQELYKYFRKNNLDYKDIILFLYNKYESEHIVEKCYDSPVVEDCRYKIRYKFNLI